MQSFEVGHVRYYDPQQVVEFPGHQVALHDFRDVAYRGLEGSELALLLAMQPDVDEDVAAEANPRLVDERHVAVDVALVFECAHASQAGRFRQVHVRGELHVADPAVLLQGREERVAEVRCVRERLVERQADVAAPGELPGVGAASDGFAGLDAWRDFANELSLDPDDTASLRAPSAMEATLKRMQQALTEFPSYAQIKAAYLTLEPWSIEDGLITQTGSHHELIEQEHWDEARDEALRLEQRLSESVEPGTYEGVAAFARLWTSVRLARLEAVARRLELETNPMPGKGKA